MSRPCPCGSGLERFLLEDARGIPCGYVCDTCEPAKRAKYRPEIFTDGDYYAEEAIDADY